MATMILSVKELGGRSHILKHILDVLQESMNLNDFSSAFSIGSALSLGSITRLKLTFDVPFLFISFYLFIIFIYLFL